jgi:hypothetical protein
LVAGEWHLSGMDPVMSRQITRLIESLVTLVAGKWLLFGMYPHCVFRSPDRERLVGEWLLSGMYPDVFL